MYLGAEILRGKLPFRRGRLEVESGLDMVESSLDDWGITKVTFNYVRSQIKEDMSLVNMVLNSIAIRRCYIKEGILE